MAKILDLGCGKNKYKPLNPDDIVIGVDKFKLEGVDVVHDLEITPYPFRDNEFDEIRLSHVIEHIHNFFGLMEECHRILKPGGKLKIWAPYGFSCLGEADHKRIIMFRTFKHFTTITDTNYITKAKFKLLRKYLNFITTKTRLRWLNYIFNPIINFNHKITEFLLVHFLPFSELYIELECIK